MSTIATDFSNQRFSYLVSLGRSERRDKSNSRVFEFVRCDCGNEKEVIIYDLLRGKTKSCGCKTANLVGAGHVKHGHGHGTPTYRSYRAAIDRCENAKNKRWARYGGRGIAVCERWRSSFAAFLQDMGERPSPIHELDRRDNDGDYEPTNCRWILRRKNLNNKSNCRSITACGQTMTLAEWSRHTGIESATIRSRIDRGWSEDRAVVEGAFLVNDLAEVRDIIRRADLCNEESMRTALRSIDALIVSRIERGVRE